MAARAPQTDRWTARENRHKGRVVLLVHGLVRVSNTNEQPRLREAAGGAGKALALDLAVEPGTGPGTQVVVWKTANYDKRVEPDQYATVDVRWEGQSVANCKIMDDGEYAQHLAAMTQAANNAQKPTRKPSPGKKRPAKKASPKRAGQRRASATANRRPAAPKKRATAKTRPSTAGKRSATARKKRPAAKRRSASRKR